MTAARPEPPDAAPLAARSRASDTATGYGWISIVVHWSSAIVVLTLWFVGSSIATAGPDALGRLRLHTSIAGCAYVLLWGRVLWRLRRGHPSALPRQRGWSFAVGRWVHFALLLVLAAMLITGPLTVWWRGEVIAVFGMNIPAPFAPNALLAESMHRWHVFGASAVLLGTVLHIAGTIKHVAFNRDGTLDKMLIAARPVDPPREDC